MSNPGAEFKAKGNAAYSAGAQLARNGDADGAKVKYQEAVEHYSKAIEKEPYNEKYYSNRSLMYLNLEKLDEAELDADRVIWCKKDWFRGYTRKADVQEKKKDYIGCMTTIIRGLGKLPDDAKLKEYYGKYQKYMPKLESYKVSKLHGNYEFTVTGNREFAMEHYKKALEELDLKGGDEYDAKTYISLNNNLAECYKQIENHKMVVHHASEVLHVDPKNFKALLRRGLSYEYIHKLDKALKDIRQVLLMDPTNKVANAAQHRIQQFANQRDDMH